MSRLPSSENERKLPPGFVESKRVGEINLGEATIALFPWSARRGVAPDVTRQVNLLKTDEGKNIFLASYITAPLVAIANEIPKDQKGSFDDGLYRMVKKMADPANCNSLPRLTDPIAAVATYYIKSDRVRVWTILLGPSEINDYFPNFAAVASGTRTRLAIRIAQSPKQNEEKVLRILSNRRSG